MSQFHFAPKGGHRIFKQGMIYILHRSTSSQAGVQLNHLGNLDT